MRWPYRDKRIEWSEEKNLELIQVRGLSFQDVALAVEDESNVLDVVPHFNQVIYPGQMTLIVKMFGYVCVVPFVVDDEKVFLKTIYKSRKFNRLFLPDSKKI